MSIEEGLKQYQAKYIKVCCLVDENRLQLIMLMFC